MLIDRILDRYEAEAERNYDYSHDEFMEELEEYPTLAKNYELACNGDYAHDEILMQSILTRYIFEEEYNPLIVAYIVSRPWTVDTDSKGRWNNIDVNKRVVF